MNISLEHLKQVLHENCEVLFDCTISAQKTKTISFSELTVTLFSMQPDLLTQLFVDFITQTRTITLSKIVKAFLDYLPASIGNDCNLASGVLQKTLESYFAQADITKSNCDRGINEAFKILVRSYLSQIQMLQLKEKTGNEIRTELDAEDKDSQQEKATYFDEANKKREVYLFCKQRFEYLDKMPPFQVEITSKLYESCTEDYVVKEQCKQNEEADFVLKKLQALLCSQLLPKQVIAEVNTFLNLNEDLRGHMSLRSITMNINEAITFLIDTCPQCLLQYGKVSGFLFFFFFLK